MPETTTGEELLSVEINELAKRIDEKFEFAHKLRETEIRWLKELVEAKLSARDQAVDKALTAKDEAVDKALTAQDKRFDSVNEFRSQLADQQRTYMTRAECDAEIKALRASTSELKERMDRTDNRGGGRGELAGWIVGAIGIAGVVFTIVESVTKHG